MSIIKEKTRNALLEWLGDSKQGYWITLDALVYKEQAINMINFESQLDKLALRLNDYCYGRAFKRGKKRLKIAGAIEIGGFMDRPHAHLVVLHSGDMTRTKEEINKKLREDWYDIVNARGSVYGTLVDLQEIGNVNGRLDYATKHLHSLNDQYCKLVML